MSAEHVTVAALLSIPAVVDIDPSTLAVLKFKSMVYAEYGEKLHTARRRIVVMV